MPATNHDNQLLFSKFLHAYIKVVFTDQTDKHKNPAVYLEHQIGLFLCHTKALAT